MTSCAALHASALQERQGFCYPAIANGRFDIDPRQLRSSGAANFVENSTFKPGAQVHAADFFWGNLAPIRVSEFLLHR